MEVTPNRNAHLLMGPPMSTPIMAPSSSPSGIAVEGLAASSASRESSHAIRKAIGWPSKPINSSAITEAPQNGMIKMGIMERSALGSFHTFIHLTSQPAR